MSCQYWMRRQTDRHRLFVCGVCCAHLGHGEEGEGRLACLDESGKSLFQAGQRRTWDTSHARDSCCWLNGKALGAPPPNCWACWAAAAAARFDDPIPPAVPGAPELPASAWPGEFCKMAPTDSAEYSFRVRCHWFWGMFPIPTRSDSLPRGLPSPSKSTDAVPPVMSVSAYLFVHVR